MRLARVAPIAPPCVWVVCFLLDSLGTFCSHKSSPAPSPFPIPLPAPIPYRAACILCLYPARPHATRWRLPAVPILASCTGCSYPFFRCLIARCCVSSGGAIMLLFFWCASRGPAPPLPFPSVCPCSVPWFPVASVFFTFLPPCTHVTTAQVIGLRLPSVLVCGPLAPAGTSPWGFPAKPGGRPTLASRSLVPSPRPTPVAFLSPVPLTASLLPLVRCAAALRARGVSRVLSHVSLPAPGPPSLRPTWAASPGIPSRGFPRHPPPPASPPSVP